MVSGKAVDVGRRGSPAGRQAVPIRRAKRLVDLAMGDEIEGGGSRSTVALERASPDHSAHGAPSRGR